MNKKKLLLVLMIFTAITTVVFLATPKTEQIEPITITSRASYEILSIDRLISESDLIVIGRVESVYPSRWNTTNGKRPEGDPVEKITPDKIIFTDMNFKIDQIIKGDNDLKKVRVRSLGGVVDQDRMIADNVVPKMEHTYLLFLYLDRIGSTVDIDPGHYWITGTGHQGLYEFVDDRAVSANDEWALEDLVIYIEKLLSRTK